MLTVNWHEIIEEDDSLCVVRHREESEVFTYPVHDHNNFWELVYCWEGGFQHTINGQVVNQEAGCCVLVRECDKHSLKGRKYSFTNIAINKDWILRLFELLLCSGYDFISGEDVKIMFFRAGDKRVIEAYIERLIHVTSPVVQRITLNQLLTFFLDKLSTSVTGISGDHDSDLPDWLMSAVKKVSADSKNADVEKLVLDCGRCREHVARSFQQYLRCSPSQFINKIRLQKAEAMLSNTNIAIGDIAMECGFNDLSYFHRLFRQRFGNSPLKYRKNFQQQTPPF